MGRCVCTRRVCVWVCVGVWAVTTLLHASAWGPGLWPVGAREDARWQPGMLMVPGSAGAKFRNPNREGEWGSPSQQQARSPLQPRPFFSPGDPETAPTPPPCLACPAFPRPQAGGRNSGVWAKLPWPQSQWAASLPELPSYKGECLGPVLPHCPRQEDPREPPDSAGPGPEPDWARGPLPAPTIHVTGHCQPCPCRMPPPPSGGGDVAHMTWPGA